MNPIKLDIDPANVDIDGICESQTPAAGGVQSLTIDGALADLGTAGVFDVSDSDSSGIKGRRIALTAVGNESARTFTVTGTDPEGAALTEALAGPNATLVESVGYFRTITGITTDDDTANAITVGTVDEVTTAVIPLNWRSNYGATVAIAGSSGTYAADIQETFDQLASQTSQDVNFNDVHADKAADAPFTLTAHARGVRVHLDSYTATAELQVHILQVNEP